MPERLVEVRVEDLEEARVDVGEDVLLAPLETKHMRGCGIGSMQRLALDVRAPPSVVGGVRTPVQRRGDDVVSTLRIGVVISSRLDDVDFARCGPRAVRVGDGQHPDGGPEPVAGGELGGDFDAAVADGGALLGVDASGLDGLDDRAVGGVRDGDAVVDEG